MHAFKKILLAFTGIALFYSCADDKDYETHDPAAQFKTDSVSIRTFLVQEGELNNFTRDPKTGIWYDIQEEGEAGGYEYKLKDSLNFKWVKFYARVQYVGKLLNGTQFDATEDDKNVLFSIESRLSNYYPFDRNSMISAWIYTFIPSKIDEYNLGGITTHGLQPGTKIRLITPSYWGYGNIARGKIPANSPLDFTITILDLQDPVVPQ